MAFDFTGWLRQPTTITGIGTFLGGVAALVADYANGSATSVTVAGGVAFMATHLIMNDNSKAAADAQALAIDVMKGAATRAIRAAIPAVLQDALKLLGDVKAVPSATDASPAPGAPAKAVAGGAIATVLGCLLLLPGCTTVAGLATAAGAAIGVSAATASTVATVVADSAALGQLFCQVNGDWVAVANASVPNASPSAVTQICDAVDPAATPGQPPDGTVAKVVTVATDLVAALDASKAATN